MSASGSAETPVTTPTRILCGEGVWATARHAAAAAGECRKLRRLACVISDTAILSGCRKTLSSDAIWANAQIRVRVAVGTAIADRPPHRSVRAGLPHTAPPLDTSVKTNIRVGMQGARRRNPPVQDWANLLPGHPRLLTPTA